MLGELGIGRSKGVVYLATLELGHGSVQEIATKAGLPRTTVHEILQQLLAWGLVSFTTKGRSRVYLAEKPTKLRQRLKEKEARLNSVLPELNLLFNTEGLRPRMRLYEGAQGVKTVLEDTLAAPDKLLYGILSMEDLYEIPGRKYMDEYVARRVAAEVRLKVIRSPEKDVADIWKTSKDELRELRYAPSYLVFPVTIYLYDSKVSVISTKRENFGMIIESVDLFQTIKSLFDVVWDLSKIVR